jgi:TPR repeat protein
MIISVGRWLRYAISNIVIAIAKIFSFIGILRSFSQGLIAADAVGKGAHAYERKNYKEAYNAVKDVAEYDMDDPYVGSSQYLLGLLYFHGYEVVENKTLAQHYFEKAAQRGNNDAITFLKSQLKKGGRGHP